MPSDFCCAFGCSEFRGRRRTESDSEDVSFHRFPIKNKNMLEKWILAIRRDNWEPTKNTKVCSKHFTSDCFETSGWSSRRSLKKDAIPTIFNFPDNCVTPLKDRRKCLKQNLQQCEIDSKDFLVLEMNTTTSLASTSTSCISPKYENNNTKNEENYKEEMDDIMEQPFVEIEIKGDLPKSECLEEDSRYEENNESNLCRFCTKPVGEDCKDVFSGDEEAVKIQEMINVILPGQVHEKDGLPHYICDVCINKWKECYETILTFFAAEAFFRSLDTHDITLQDQLVFSDSKIELPEVFLEPDLATEQCNENNIPIYDWQNKIKIKSSSIEDLALHRETEHSSTSNINQLYCCNKCSMMFKNENSLQLHIKSNHSVEKIEFACEDCPKLFNFKHLLIHHRKLKHKKHICKICGDMFYYLKTLDRHMSVHNDSIKCSTCNKEFKNAYWRRVHEKSHTIDNNHLCWICGKFFQIKSTLDAHLLSHNGLKMMPYKCNMCGKEYFSLSGINKHKLIHKERVRSFKCSQCEKNFFTNESLKQHFSSHSNIKPFMCHCGVAFKRRSNLYNHKKRHLLQQNSNKPRRPVEINKDTEVFTCALCGKEIVSKLRFKYHLGKHTGNKKPFDCETCGSVFGNLTNYKNHINIHSSELSFVCETCGLGFRTGRMLKQHKLVHEEGRPYACPTCPVSFKRLYSLKEHKIVHSGLRPYECTLCRRAFARRSDCRKHVKRTHVIPVQQLDAYVYNVIRDGHNDKSDNECDSLNIKEKQVSELVVEVDNSVKNDITISEV